MSAPIAKAVIGYVSPAKFKKKMRHSSRAFERRTCEVKRISMKVVIVQKRFALKVVDEYKNRLPNIL